MARKKRRLKKFIGQRGLHLSHETTKISDLLSSPYKLQKTVKKAFQYETLQKIRRQDPNEQRRLHQRSLAKEKARRDLMLRAVAERQRRLTQQPPIIASDENKLDSKKRDVCRRRRDKRVALFASRQIGKGKGSGKKRKYTENSKIKC